MLIFIGSDTAIVAATISNILQFKNYVLHNYVKFNPILQQQFQRREILHDTVMSNLH